jgi:hypothetical protein
MRLAFGLVGLLLVACIAGAAFWVGRFSAPAPTFAPRATAGVEDDLAVAWGDFVRAQNETLQLFRSHDFFGDDQERAEAYRGILYSMVGAIKTGVLMDPDRPRFMRAVDWTGKSGLDNPDNTYYVALVRDDAEYRITGTRGTTATLSFQLVVGQPGVRGAGTSTNLSVLEGRRMRIEPDGSFEIHVGRGDPGEGRNWLPVGDGAETLLVRFSHSDWDREHGGRLQIERIGDEAEAGPRLDSAQMAERLRDAAAALFDRNATWIEYATKAWTLMPRNGISKVRPSRGGLVGQYSAFGSFELGEDRALILTTTPSEALYQGVQLGNLWFVSLDYEGRTSSLTTDQAYLSADGRYHFVICERDPGVQNWLDTEGHRRGLIMLRWQGLDGPLSEDRQPTARLVDFDRVRQELPSDTPVFGAEDRRDQIRRRRAHVQRRFDG